MLRERSEYFPYMHTACTYRLLTCTCMLWLGILRATRYCGLDYSGAWAVSGLVMRPGRDAVLYNTYIAVNASKLT